MITDYGLYEMLSSIKRALTASRVRAVNPRRGMLILLLAALATLGACTGSFIYNRLDFIIPFYFGQRVTLEEPQEAQLKAAVRGFTAWHRTSQLKRYSEFLRGLAQDAQRPTTREEIEAAAETMEGFWDDLVAEILPQGAQLLRTLSPKQVDELLTNFAEDDENDYEEYCEPPPKALIGRRIKAMTRSVKHWAKTLTDEQKALIERTARRMKLLGCASLESRALWRAEVKNALFDDSDAAATQARLRVLLLEPHRTWTEEYREGFLTNRSLIIDMLAELDTTWSDKQRQAISRRLNAIADDLEELAGTGLQS